VVSEPSCSETIAAVRPPPIRKWAIDEAAQTDASFRRDPKADDRVADDAPPIRSMSEIAYFFDDFGSFSSLTRA
jgi:hypothetical protein